jgi:O-antigen ligase
VWAWTLAAIVAVAPAGFTYARAAFGGAALAGAAFLRGARSRRPGYRLAIIALLVGFGVPAVLGMAGWVTRAEVGLDVSRRDQLVGQAIALIKEHPLTGVGPGRQLIALRELAAREPGVVTYLNAVHDVPLTVAVEAGIAGLIVSALLFVVVGYRSFRAGGPALALFLAYVPIVLLDHFPFTHQHGLVITGLWLGFIELTADRARA